MANNYDVGNERFKNVIRDAEITLSNGDTKMLGSVEIGTTVMCKNKEATVAEVWDDVEIEKMVFLEAGGKSVILRKYHPVLTEKGIVVACEIKKGMKVLTKENGYEVVNQVKLVNYYDQVIDIDLKREGISNISENIFYMNGIAVGDYTYENHLEYFF